MLCVAYNGFISYCHVASAARSACVVHARCRVVILRTYNFTLERRSGIAEFQLVRFNRVLQGRKSTKAIFTRLCRSPKKSVGY
jgi:hypothetical protein